MPQEKIDEELHDLHGTESQAAPDAPPLEASRPRCPKELGGEAKKAFRALCRTLEARRALTAGDAEILRLYAILFDRHKRAISHVLAEGEICPQTVLSSNGDPVEVLKPNQWLKVAQDAEGRMRGLLADLGLNPMSRPKVKPTKSEGEAGIKYL